MFKENLFRIKKDCKLYHRDKSTLMYMYVNGRLSKSLKIYYKEIQDSSQYLNNRKEDSLIKKFKKGI